MGAAEATLLTRVDLFTSSHTQYEREEDADTWLNPIK